MKNASSTLKCPLCGEPASLPQVNRNFPFCSEKCRMVDLGRWFDGQYALDPATGKLDMIDPDKAEEIELPDDEG